MALAILCPMVISATVRADPPRVDSAVFNGDVNYCIKYNRLEVKYHCWASSSMTIRLFAPWNTDSPIKTWTVSGNYPNENTLTDYSLPANPQGLWQIRAQGSSGSDLFDYRAIGYLEVGHALNQGFDPNTYTASMNALLPVSYDSQSPIAVLSVQAVNVATSNGYPTLQLKIQVLYQDYHHTYQNGPAFHDNTCNCIYSIKLHFQKVFSWTSWPGRYPNLTPTIYGGSYASDVAPDSSATGVGGWNVSAAQSVSGNNLQSFVTSVAGMVIGAIPVVGGISYLISAAQLASDIHQLINPIQGNFVESPQGSSSEASVYWQSNYSDSHGQPIGLNGSAYDYVYDHFCDAHASFAYKIWADITYADGWHIVGGARNGYWAATLRTASSPAVYIGVPSA
jgi:hypothetical protein